MLNKTYSVFKMIKLFLSPFGRVNSTSFWKASLLLILFNLTVILSSLVSIKIFWILTFVSFASVWCWFCLWIKRYHDAGKSGWMSLIPFFCYLGFAFLLSFFLSAQFGISVEERLLYNEKILDASNSGNMEAVWSMSRELSAIEAKKMAIPNSIFTVCLGLTFVWFFNGVLIVQDPEPNKFGSPE